MVTVSLFTMITEKYIVDYCEKALVYAHRYKLKIKYIYFPYMMWPNPTWTPTSFLKEFPNLWAIETRQVPVRYPSSKLHIIRAKFVLSTYLACIKMKTNTNWNYTDTITVCITSLGGFDVSTSFITAVEYAPHLLHNTYTVQVVWMELLHSFTKVSKRNVKLVLAVTFNTLTSSLNLQYVPMHLWNSFK